MAVVAVVVPHYNQPEYLEECLRSVQNQTFQDWQIIVVDDASTLGDAEAIISRLADKRIQLIRHESNQGLGAARNTGFRATAAPLVLPVDSDDRLHPEFLDSTVNVLLNQPDFDCVYTEFQLFGSSNQIWQFEVRAPEEMLQTQWIPGPGTLMRKKLWHDIGGYSEVMQLTGNDDWEFWIRAIRHGLKPYKICRPLYLYRRHSDSMSATALQDRDYRTREIIYRLHREFFDQYQAGSQFRAEGYLNSSLASMKRGKRWSAIWLAFRGVLLQPSSGYLKRQLARVLAPEALVRMSRRFRAHRSLQV
jgi:glycosyltransferase involved in cell wall biosynthesis